VGRWVVGDDPIGTQAHNNKPEYAGYVRSVSMNILPMQGSIHLYYTPSQARSPNAPPSVVIFEMIEKALQVKKEQHKQEMEERLAQQREEMRDEHKQQREEIMEEHKQLMEAMNAVITERFAAQMVAYEARFRSLEGSTLVSLEPEVTTERVVQDLGSPACRIVKSSANSTQGNN
jgi:hypothetical protein